MYSTALPALPRPDPAEWRNAAELSGTQMNLLTTGASHFSGALVYQTVVSVQAFSFTFTFGPNGQNIAFALRTDMTVLRLD